MARYELRYSYFGEYVHEEAIGPFVAEDDIFFFDSLA